MAIDINKFKNGKNFIIILDKLKLTNLSLLFIILKFKIYVSHIIKEYAK